MAACVIGGTAVTGGVGRVFGAIVGALIMGVLTIGLSIEGVDPSWQFVIKGPMLMLAVAFDLVRKRRSRYRPIAHRVATRRLAPLPKAIRHCCDPPDGRGNPPVYRPNRSILIESNCPEGAHRDRDR